MKQPTARYVRLKRLIAEYVPVSEATIWRWVTEGTFPKPIKLHDRVTAWLVKDVESWLESKK